jgi:aryl-alcohol dehydrogenase-like predicted oxidoreductase
VGTAVGIDGSVTCAIPGARSVAQAPENAAAADLSPFSESDMAAVGAVYGEKVRGIVHAQW